MENGVGLRCDCWTKRKSMMKKEKKNFENSSTHITNAEQDVSVLVLCRGLLDDNVAVLFVGDVFFCFVFLLFGNINGRLQTFSGLYLFHFFSFFFFLPKKDSESSRKQSAGE